MSKAVKSTQDHPSDRLPKERRAMLFHAATEEFAAHGFTRASLNRIIAQVGMSKSSFYHYFENKTDLFLKILNSAMAPLADMQLTLALEQLDENSFWPTIRTTAAGLMQEANKNTDSVLIGRIFYRSLENPEERKLIDDVLAETNAFLLSVLEHGQKIGCVRTDLPQTLLIDFALSLSMASDRWILAHWDEFDASGRLALSGKVMDLFHRAMAPGQ